MKDVYDFLKKADTYYLATVDGNLPKVRPFGTVDIFEGRLYFQTGKSKDIAKQIAANPHISICAMDGGAWLRVEAEAVLDDRVEAKKHLLDAYPNLRAMYDENDGNTAVYYLKNASATVESFTEPKRTYSF